MTFPLFMTYTLSSNWRIPTTLPTPQPTKSLPPPTGSYATASLNEIVVERGASFIPMAIAAVAFVGLAYAIVRLRLSLSKVFQLRLFAVCAHMGLFGFSFVSEVVLLAILLPDPKFSSIGTVILLARSCNAVSAGYLLTRIFGGSKPSSSNGGGTEQLLLVKY